MSWFFPFLIGHSMGLMDSSSNGTGRMGTPRQVVLRITPARYEKLNKKDLNNMEYEDTLVTYTTDRYVYLAFDLTNEYGYSEARHLEVIDFLLENQLVNPPKKKGKRKKK